MNSTRRLIRPFLFLILLPLGAHGQGTQLEAYVGLSFASMGTSYKYSTGYNPELSSGIRIPFGLAVDFQMSDNLLFGTGVHYSPRGAKVALSSTQVHLNYIDIPALLVIQPSTFRVFIGPQLSFLTSADIDGDDISEAIESTSFGIRYGMGLDTKVFVFRITGQNGFSDVNKFDNEEWTTHAYTLSVGYLIVKRREGGSPNKPRKNDVVPSHRKIDF